METNIKIIVMMLIGIELLIDIFENIKKKNTTIFFDIPIISRRIFSNIVLVALWFRVVKILYDVGIAFFMFLWTIVFLIVLHSTYKIFRDKEIELNHIQSDIFDEVVFEAFENYGYTLEEYDEEDEVNKKQLNIKGTKAYLSITKKENKDQYIQMNIIRYRKIKDLEKIMEEIRNILLKREKVNPKFHIGMKEFIPLFIGIIGGGIYFLIFYKYIF